MWFYVNGEFVEDADATVSVTDHSFLYGDGCFEGIGVSGGRILHLDAHVERMFHSARMLRIEMPVAPDELRHILLETAARNGMREAPSGYMRPLVTRGAGPLGLKFSHELGQATLVVIPQLGDRILGYSGDMEVLTAVVVSYVRASPAALEPRIKSNNYLTSVMSFLEANDRGADLGIIRDAHGYVSEGHAMNLFCVRDGRLRAPLESAALGGITRAHVMAEARGLGVECLETNLTTWDLLCSDEVFITSSLEGVAAISRIDGTDLPGTVPGPITSQIRQAYVSSALASGAEIPARAKARA